MEHPKNTPADTRTAEVGISLPEAALISTALSFMHAILHSNGDRATQALWMCSKNIEHIGGCGNIKDLQSRLVEATRSIATDATLVEMTMLEDRVMPLEAARRARASRYN